MEQTASTSTVDPVWTTSRTARQIYDLGEVEKVRNQSFLKHALQHIYDEDNVMQDITRLLRLAASSVSLLTLPQTDEPGSKLPQGDERPEQFVMEVGEYFERLDSIQTAIRSALAHIRRSRIAPSAINAPPQDFIPPSLGIGVPSEGSPASSRNRGLQEEKVDREAWKGILDALTRLKAERDAERQKDRSNDEEGSKALKE
ncbi:hypothetical protein NMY22_g14054 [Coprinellus aureogranulatus]|nr:hypothetical protein NMY22_g14054 [Coprinellus aureogranulatus]